MKVSFFILGIMVFISIVCSVVFTQEEFKFNKYRYMVNDDNTITISQYVGEGVFITIPSEIDGKTVTKIADTFIGNPMQELKMGEDTILLPALWTQVSGITIPPTVTVIGESAFDGLTLKEIVIIGGQAGFALSYFDKFSTLEIIHDDKDNIIDHREFIVENGVLKQYRGKIVLYDREFDMAGSDLSSAVRLYEDEVYVPEYIYGQKIKTIGEEAFAVLSYIQWSYDIELMLRQEKNMYAIDKIVLPYGIEEIGDRAFYGRNVLKTVIIPSSVKNVGEGIFSETTSLREVIDENGTVYGSADYVVIGNTIYKYIGEEEDVTIPDTVNGVTITGIDTGAFSKNKNIKTVIMPDTIERLGKASFSDCENLEKVVLSNKLTDLPDKLFNDSYKLKTVVVPSAVERIDHKIFNKNTVIYTEKDSAADEHAKKYDLQVEYID